MRKLYVVDEEEARLQRIALAVTADLEDRARVQRQIDEGSLALKGGAVVLK